MASLATEITVVGGGMVGSAAALSLAREGYQVFLVEAGNPPGWTEEDYALRVSAISAASECLLQAIGAWDRIADLRVSPYQHMHVWDAQGDACLDFDAADSGRASLGHIVENDLINMVLLDQLQQLPNVRVEFNTPFSAIEQTGGRVIVRLRDGRRLESRLLLAADGASSHVRQLTGIGSDGRDYQQQGIVARVQTEHSHQATAWQRFMPTGPLAFLPLADGSCSVVWSADNHYAEELMACTDDEFAKHLGAGVEYRLGKVEMLSKRGAFPLFMSHAKSYTAGRVVLLGDAAHRVHPLAGQGVNLGFQDVAHLVATLDQARKNDRAIDDPMYLRRFSRERRAQAALMIAGMDGIQRVFANELTIVSRVRSMGMQLINRVPQIKQFFVDRALGN